MVRNPVFVFCTLGGVTEGIVTAGFATFLPKFVQNQFTLTPGSAALITGIKPPFDRYMGVLSKTTTRAT